MNRVGIGHDTHRLEAGRKLILGGILVDYPRGLSGHSDADIVLHALTDAILGAAGLGDIGDAFPIRMLLIKMLILQSFCNILLFK